MATLRATADDALFIGTTRNQEGGQNDWVDYQPVLKGLGTRITIDTDLTTNTRLYSTTTIPSNSNILLKEGTDTNVVSVMVSSVSTPSSDIGDSVASVSQELNFNSSFNRSCVLSNDGTKLFLIDDVSNSILQYNLPTPNVITGATYDNVSLDVSSQTTSPMTLQLNPNGTSLYVTSQTDNTLYEYTLPTANRLNTASYSNNSASLSPITSLGGFTFTNGGSNLLACSIGSGSGTNVYQFNLTTAYDLSTLSYSNTSVSLSTQTAQIADVKVSKDGSKMFVVSTSTNIIYQYRLSTAGTVASVAYDNTSFTVSANPESLFFYPDGFTFLVTFGTDRNIRSYTTNINGFSSVNLTDSSLTNAPTQACFANLPTLATSLESVSNRVSLQDTAITGGTFTTTSATVTLTSSNVFATGDTIGLVIGGVNTLVVSTNVAETDLGGGSYQYVVTYDTQASAPTSAYIPDRSAIDVSSSMAWDNDVIDVTYVNALKTGRAINYKLTGTTGAEVRQLTYNLKRT